MKGAKKRKPKAQALRYNGGKPKLSRVLCFPAAIVAMANVTEFGEQKYPAYNMLKGAPLSETLDSMLRHVVKFWCRVETDPESDLNEMSGALWNTARATDEVHRKPAGYVDDRPPAGTYDAEQILALLNGAFPGQVIKRPKPTSKPKSKKAKRASAERE